MRAIRYSSYRIRVDLAQVQPCPGLLFLYPMLIAVDADLESLVGFHDDFIKRRNKTRIRT